MRQNQLAFFVFLIFDEHFHGVADLDVGIVAEFAHWDDAVALITDVNHGFALVECDNGTFDYILVLDGVERLIVGAGELFAGLLTGGFAFFIGVPIEVFDRGFGFFCHLKS